MAKKKKSGRPAPAPRSSAPMGQLDLRIGRHVRLHVYVSPAVLAGLVAISGTLGGALALLR